MDGHVLEHTPRLRQVLRRRRGRVAGDDGELLDAPDPPVGGEPLGLRDGGVVAALETNHHRRVLEGRELVGEGAGRLDGGRDRLLAQRGLARAGGRQDVLGVQGGGGTDDNRVHVVGGEGVGGVGGGARPEGFGEGLRGLDERVADQHEPGLGMGGDGGGMDLADATRAYHCDAQHVVSFLGVRCPLGVEAGLLALMPICWAYSRLPALQRRQTATGPANRVQGQQTGLFRGPGQGAGTMMSRTRASRSASAARNWRSVLRVGPNSSNSSMVMPSGS